MYGILQAFSDVKQLADPSLTLRPQDWPPACTLVGEDDVTVPAIVLPDQVSPSGGSPDTQVDLGTRLQEHVSLTRAALLLHKMTHDCTLYHWCSRWLSGTAGPEWP